MPTTELKATIHIENIEIAIEKASQLKTLLEEVHILISSLNFEKEIVCKDESVRGIKIEI